LQRLIGHVEMTITIHKLSLCAVFMHKAYTAVYIKFQSVDPHLIIVGMSDDLMICSVCVCVCVWFCYYSIHQ